MRVRIPQQLADSCRVIAERRAWLAHLPDLIDRLAVRWSLCIDYLHPFDAGAAWVVPATTADGTSVIFKIIMPHMEAEDEIKGLRFWAGDPTVELLEADDVAGAMVIERCKPGTSLRAIPERAQDSIIADLLRRIWRRPTDLVEFRPLSAMICHWSAETLADAAHWPDTALVRRGLASFAELCEDCTDEVLLVTDLHADNALRAEREPWLVIDPKPFVGDRAYDATQHLLNCRDRLETDTLGTVSRFAALLQVDEHRVLRWLFARLAAEPRESWDRESTMLARQVAQLL